MLRHRITSSSKTPSVRMPGFSCRFLPSCPERSGTADFISNGAVKKPPAASTTARRVALAIEEARGDADRAATLEQDALHFAVGEQARAALERVGHIGNELALLGVVGAALHAVAGAHAALARLAHALHLEPDLGRPVEEQLVVSVPQLVGRLVDVEVALD